MKSFKYFKPQTLEEAVALLTKYDISAHILNGGTDLIVRMRDKLVSPEVVIDIKGIKELYDITYDDKKGLIIGSCVTLNDMSQNRIVIEKYNILSQAAHTVGSLQVRNRATMAGNICNASPLADTATPLLILDSYVHIYGSDGEREESIHDFFKGVRRTSLKIGDIVTGIRIPGYNRAVFGDYQKLSRRKEVDLSTVCASIANINGEIRIALGAVAPTPIRSKKTEEYLLGKELTDEVIAEAKEITALEASPIDDVRASREYRREMVKVLVARGLRNIRERQ